MPTLLVVFSIVIVISSLVGGWLPTTLKMTHLRMQLTLSLVAGVMLGVATLHLLPQASNLLGSRETMGIALAGILFMFFLNRIFHFHQHDVAQAAPGAPPEPSESRRHDHHHHDHDHHHDHHHDHAVDEQRLSSRDITGFGLFFGMSVHSLIDGVALGAAVWSEPHGHWSGAGFSVFLAIALHKPLDAMSITSLMTVKKWRSSSTSLANLLFSLLTPLGAVGFFVLGESAETASLVTGAALAFSAGVFLCISLGDLLPEVHFHHHDRIWLSLALILGILIAVGIEMLPGHSHGAPQSTAPLDPGGQ